MVVLLQVAVRPGKARLNSRGRRKKKAYDNTIRHFLKQLLLVIHVKVRFPMIRSLIGQESTRNTLHQSDTKLPPIATFPLLSRFEFSLALCDIFLFSDWPLEDN